MSTKSECGVDGTRPVSWMGGSVDTTRRNWCSESQLERRDHQAGAGRLQAAGHKPFKALSLNTLLKVRFIKKKKNKAKTKISSAGSGPGWTGDDGEGEDEDCRGQYDGKHQGGQ